MGRGETDVVQRNRRLPSSLEKFRCDGGTGSGRFPSQTGDGGAILKNVAVFAGERRFSSQYLIITRTSRPLFMRLPSFQSFGSADYGALSCAYE
jgi:hypothetical protein